jgi:RNA polymerase sigma-70 factor (ECF subfamily)
VGVTEPQISDQQLIVRILAGDPEGAAVLVRRYGGPLRRVLLHAGARPEDLDDLLQETWIRVIRSAARYDPAQAFSGWLFTIAMNRFRTRAARLAEDRRRHEPLESATTAPASGASAHAALEAAERAAGVRGLIAALPPRLADAVLLRYFEEWSEKEIAAAMGIPVGTVKSRLHTAIARLRVDLARSHS